MAELDYEVEDTLNEDETTTDYENNQEDFEETDDGEEYSKSEQKIFKDLGIDINNATIDDLKKVTKILAKTQKTVVKYKTGEKVSKKTKTDTKDIPTSKDEVKRILAEERFYDKNPDAEAYRGKIEEYQSKGLSLDDAYVLATKNDKQIDRNREVYGQSLVKGKTSSDNLAVLSIDDFDKLPVQAQQNYTTKMVERYGNVKFK